MPKLKTRKGFAKRIRVTKTGKLIRGRRVPKAARHRRKYQKVQQVSKTDRMEVLRALGSKANGAS